jgi:hypothetical protein
VNESEVTTVSSCCLSLSVSLECLLCLIVIVHTVHTVDTNLGDLPSRAALLSAMLRVFGRALTPS